MMKKFGSMSRNQNFISFGGEDIVLVEHTEHFQKIFLVALPEGGGGGYYFCTLKIKCDLSRETYPHFNLS